MANQERLILIPPTYDRHGGVAEHTQETELAALNVAYDSTQKRVEAYRRKLQISASEVTAGPKPDCPMADPDISDRDYNVITIGYLQDLLELHTAELRLADINYQIATLLTRNNEPSTAPQDVSDSRFTYLDECKMAVEYAETKLQETRDIFVKLCKNAESRNRVIGETVRALCLTTSTENISLSDKTDKVSQLNNMV